MTIEDYLFALLDECESLASVNGEYASFARDETEYEFWLVVDRIKVANIYAEDGNIKACREVMREIRGIIGATEE